MKLEIVKMLLNPTTNKSLVVVNNVLALLYAIANIQFVDAMAINKNSAHQMLEDESTSIKQPNMPKFPHVDLIQTVYDPRRPIWNLAHMVNSIKELDYRLEKGANAVEVDITFDRDGTPLYTYHGPPCDCWRHCHQQENFNEYLSYVREIAIEEKDGIGKNLSLLFLDLKLDYLEARAKGVAGQELAKSIIENLYTSLNQQQQQHLQQTSKVNQDLSTSSNNQSKQLYLILSVNHVTDIELIYNFLYYLENNNSTHLLNKIGFDVGMNDDLHMIETMWKKFKNTLNVWQGDGFTNCFSPFYNLERLSKALVKRDNDNGYPSKVYHWTIDLHDRIRESLLMGVDAVMTNHPERLLTILREPEMAANFRLATNQDNPFIKITRRVSAGSSPRSTALSPRRERSSPNVPVSGGFFASLLDVFNSWLAYVREIPFLSLPTTSRFMPKTKRRRIQDEMAARSQSNNTIDLKNSSLIPDKQEAQQYQGPKWYTTMASNFLLSILKVLLPTG